MESNTSTAMTSSLPRSETTVTFTLPFWMYKTESAGSPLTGQFSAAPSKGENGRKKETFARREG
jgi:hypothetical protein